jgi:diguanylate cyclase (GGDEF)-like protein
MSSEQQSPKSLTLVCDDLGEIDQVIQDDLGLPPIENGKSGKTPFSRLLDRLSQAKARAFFADLRIAHKVVGPEFAIQTTNGLVNIHLAGVKSGNQFVIVGAETPEFRDKLYAEVMSVVSETEAQKQKLTADHFSEKKKPVDDVKQPVVTVEMDKPRKDAAREQEELEKLRQDFYELATTDSLTGLYNRRHFLKRMREELLEADRYKRSPVFLMVDIDNFGAINEKYGYEIGDDIIRTLGEFMRSLLRNVDLVGRLGGDEFGALLHEGTLATSVVTAKRLQKKLAGVAMEINGQNIQVTVSVALLFIGVRKVNVDKLLKQAEKQIQKAKESGGNQIILE